MKNLERIKFWKIFQKIIFLLLMIFAFSACEQDLKNPNIDIDRKIVVYADFTVGETPNITLYISRLMTDRRFVDARLPNAKIKISENDILIGEYTSNLDGWCKPSVVVKPETKYSIEVSSSNYSTVYGEVTTSREIKISSRQPENARVYLDDNMKDCMKYNLEIEDLPGSEDYYLIEVVNSDYSFSNNLELLADKVFIQPENLMDNKLIFINDKLFDGKKYNQIFYSTKHFMNSDNYVKVKISQISHSLYQFLFSYSKMNEYDELFSEQVTDYTNIKNGYGIIYSRYNYTFSHILSSK